MFKTLQEKLGPGLVYAGVAIGVSHLVQSTTAGANFGLIMCAYMVFVCLVKYPTFLFGARYTGATGKTLVDGYEEMGKWIVLLYFALQMFEYTFAISGVVITTVGMVKSVFGIGIGDIPLAFMLIIACILILSIGRYPILEDITKTLVISFTVVTVIVAMVAVFGIDTGGAELSSSIEFNTPTILFLVAAAGWMPTGTAGAVGISLWVKAKAKRLQRPVTLEEANFDFNVGYGASIFTAVCFVILGTYVLHINQVPLETSGAGFATQFMNIFSSIIGGWIYPFVAFAAITVMISTLLTLVDLLPRTSTEIVTRLQPVLEVNESRIYNGFIIVELLLVGAVLLLLLDQFNTFINLVTSMGFIVAPAVSILNHYVIFSDQVPKDKQPGPVLRAWSWGTIVTLTLVALMYVYLQFLV